MEKIQRLLRAIDKTLWRKVIFNNFIWSNLNLNIEKFIWKLLEL